MIRAILSRIRQGHRTMPYPQASLQMPERLRGYPAVAANITGAGGDNCPYGAYNPADGGSLDMGRCLFCAECPVETVSFSNDFQLAVSGRDELIVRPGGERHHARQLSVELLKLFGRSLRFREVSAGGCNACEADTNVLSTVGWDLGRFGIQFVASPRHADGLWITGPVTENMKQALLTTYEAIPAPKIVVACGACAINGGPFVDGSQLHNGADSLLPVDLYIPGCPPHPATILEGLLRLINRIS